MIEIPKDIFADVPSKCKECSKSHKDWLAEHDRQIRNEVIDKYTEKLRPIVSQLRSELKNNPYAFIDLDCIAGQMKENR